jgi:hypothetical protein
VAKPTAAFAEILVHQDDTGRFRLVRDQAAGKPITFHIPNFRNAELERKLLDRDGDRQIRLGLQYLDDKPLGRPETPSEFIRCSQVLFAGQGCKRNAPDNKVGAPMIQQFKGVIEEQAAIRGYFVTTSSFTDMARQSAEKSDKVILVDMDFLVGWEKTAPTF